MQWLASSMILLLMHASAATTASNAQNPLDLITLVAPDESIKVSLIPFGATATNVWVKDKRGAFRDILLGFDNHTNYMTDALGHPYFGPIVGRYANRIKNGSFTIPITRKAQPNARIFHIPTNENNGADTLHGGNIGFDRRIWNTSIRSSNSVTFTLVDPDGMQGFPGTVHAQVVYTLLPGSTWRIKMHANASAATPIMLSGHHYWNLEAYKESQDLIGHIAQFSASQVIGTDGILVPNGKIIDVFGTPLDFRKAKSLGTSINATAPFGFCGTNCVGFDNCWIYDKLNNIDKPKFSLWSVNSGIRMEVTTNQPALQVYTCNGIAPSDAPIPRKQSQGGPLQTYADHSCVVVEQESWIDAINNPEFGIDQIFGPGKDYNWEAQYVFSVDSRTIVHN